MSEWVYIVLEIAVKGKGLWHDEESYKKSGVDGLGWSMDGLIGQFIRGDHILCECDCPCYT